MAFYPYGQPNYGNYGSYPQPNYQPSMSQPIQSQQQMQAQAQANNAPKTNKIFVPSLDVALSMPTEPNSVMIYLHQDLPLLFEISTDFFGRKASRTFDLSESKQKPAETAQGQAIPDLSGYVTKDEYKAVEGRLERIETILNGGSKPTTKKTAKETEDKE